MIHSVRLLQVLIATAVVLMCLPLSRIAQAAQAEREFKVLHVMSYHSPWRWTDWQFEGFRESLHGLKVDYRVFQMDTKRNSSIEQKQRKGREARELIDAWKPDLVYTTDDDAQEYVTRHYLNASIPFVFSGVGNSPVELGLAGISNVTGVLEQEHFVETASLVRKIVPKAKRIALIFDDASMWSPVRARIERAAERLPGMQIVAMDVALTFSEYKRRILQYQTKADVIGTLGIFNLKDEHGRNVPYQEVQKWTVENSTLPDFSFWVDRVHFGTLCAVTVSEREQGRAAGRLAWKILVEGRKPGGLAIEPTRKGVPVLSLARARKLGIRLDAEVLLSAEVIKRFDWDPP